jgi:hypothetical protein
LKASPDAYGRSKRTAVKEARLGTLGPLMGFLAHVPEVAVCRM